MKREPANLADRRFDVLVIGAGIYGACIAREATLRGLSIALVDRDDFGGATSANSLKTIHGGLRYLQSLDIRRMRESIRERRTLMNLAPHLVHPLPFVVPTHGWGRRSRTAMRAALQLTDWLAPDEADPGDPAHRLPASRVFSRTELVELFPSLASADKITGGALWYDAQAYSTERLTLAFVRDAVERGAVAVNHLEVRRLLLWNGRVVGAAVRDQINGTEFETRAEMVVNAAGPWMDQILRSIEILSHRKPLLLAKAWNIITKSLHGTHAIGLLAGHGGLGGYRDGRMLFIMPWHGRSIIGTMYAPADEDTGPQVTDQEVEYLLNAINLAYPGEQLCPDDVTFRHGGLLPVRRRDASRGVDTLADRPIIIDHQLEDHVGGLLSVCGVKYTTARLVAEQVLDRICEHLGRRGKWPDSSHIPVDGGDFERFDALEADLRTRAPNELAPVVDRLARHYGTRAEELIQACTQEPAQAARVCESASILQVEIRHAVRDEMAVKLADVVMRRTDVGSLGHPGVQALRNCANIMAEELRWPGERTEAEISEVIALFD